ncbi:MAG: hypothetical protein WBP47_10505 [Candidatus Promineifilaceae bacterium]
MKQVNQSRLGGVIADDESSYTDRDDDGARQRVTEMAKPEFTL